jgi:hypothetical protein
LAKCLNTTSANTTSSRRDNATNDTWTASTGDVADAWYVFSATSAFQRITAGKIQDYRRTAYGTRISAAVDAFRRRLLSSSLQYADKLGRVAATLTLLPPTSLFSSSLDTIGEWWSLLIFRDALYGIRRFSDFQEELGIGKERPERAP